MDDDLDILEGYQIIFENEGFNIEYSSDPIDALQKATENQFDVAIMDYMLPHMSGDELAEGLRRINKDMTLIFVTGYAYADDACKPRNIEGVSFLMKPIEPLHLVTTIRSIISRSCG
ncbi:MAG: response regulator [Candidatus Bathyarchaeota archaeon]|nr:response regulator [Candidatus Bathyarchaeota archaeon]